MDNYISKSKIRKVFDYLVVAASLILMIAISVEILDGDSRSFGRWYLNLQLAICTLFITDFFVTMATEKDKMRYFWSHLIILIMSLPYLSIYDLSFVTLEREGLMLIAIMPILRAFVAIYILLRWMMRHNRAERLLFAYILSALSFIYVSALLFYDCEINADNAIHGFGDALWWAALAFTTTDLPIAPVTATAKILAVALPIAGMLMLPIVANYLMSRHSGN